MARALRVIAHLIAIHMRGKLQYRGALFIGWIAQAIGYAGLYGSIGLIIARFEGLGGWSWPEMALLMSFNLLAYALGACMSLVQFRDMEDKIRLGTLDAILVKPIGPWTYLAFSGFNIEYVGHVSLAIGLMVWSLSALSIEWVPLTVLFFAGSLISGILCTASLLTMIGATALIWVRSRHLFSIFFGFWELSRYPLPIFPVPLQALMLTIAPLAYMAYVPVAVLLGKDVPLLGGIAPIITLLAGPLLVLLTMAYWRHGLRNYQGAGG